MSHASNTGWGAICAYGSTSGKWKPSELEWHINERELAACILGLRCFADKLCHCTIRLQLDNTTLVCARLNKLTRLLWLWALKRDLKLLASYKPGVQNIEADLLSRRSNDSSDYSLDGKTTMLLFAKWGVPKIDLFASRSGRSGRRRFRSSLVGDLRLRLSAIQSSREDNQKSPEREGTLDSGVPHVEKSKLVATSNGARQRNHAIDIRPEPSDGLQRVSSSMPQISLLSYDSMHHLGEFWRGGRAERGVVQSIMSNWSRATIKQYNSALKKWAAFCKNTRYRQLFESGASFSSISTHKSAIIVYLSAINGEFCRKDMILVNRCMKGFFRQRPPRPRYADIWDVSAVLKYLRSLGPNATSGSRTLNSKTVMLLAPVVPKRVFELAALSLDSVLLGRGLIRQRHTQRSCKPIKTISSYVLLVTIKDYINRTILYRNQVRTLFMIVNRPRGTLLGATTIARWLREVLKNSGIDDRFKAHSTRAASTTFSKRQGLSSKAIMEAANWAPNGTTFEKFYYRGPLEQSFQDSLLSSNRKSKRSTERRDDMEEKRKKEKEQKRRKSHLSKK
ncbi:site-specific recombinase, phage integrase family [Cooperia oncophora]